MIAKLKECSACNKQSPIWKNYQGKRYCRICWTIHKPLVPVKLSKPKAIKQVSDKQQKLNAVYSIARNEFLSRPGNKCCKARLVSECTGCTTELTIHHSKGRGKYLLDTTTWKALCLLCHMYVETHPEEAKALGYSDTRV